MSPGQLQHTGVVPVYELSAFADHRPYFRMKLVKGRTLASQLDRAILGKYLREEQVIPLEDAIRKMTSAVAARLSIRDRGLLREGFYADVVIFDPEMIADRATFEKPHLASVGVQHVIINGTAVVQEGRHTGAKPGQIVRWPGYVPHSRPVNR